LYNTDYQVGLLYLQIPNFQWVKANQCVQEPNSRDDDQTQWKSLIPEMALRASIMRSVTKGNKKEKHSSSGSLKPTRSRGHLQQLNFPQKQ
jgi:hypothetical protein